MGYYIILLVFLFYYRSMSDFLEISLATKTRLGQSYDLTQLIVGSGLVILLNYTIAFLLSKKYSKFSGIIFLATVFLLIILLIFALPHFKVVLLGS